MIEKLHALGLHDISAEITRERLALIGELARVTREAEALRALVRRAAQDSTVTTSDGPGCFYCDHEEHTADCPAAPLLIGGGHGE